MADEVVKVDATPPKLRKAHAEVIYLEACPACGRYAVTPDQRGRARFCLACRWVDTE